MPCLDVIMIAFLPRNIHESSLLARKERVNVERVPTGHLIILLKSNKFDVTAVSEKRSIILLLYPMPLYRSISNSSCSVTSSIFANNYQRRHLKIFTAKCAGVEEVLKLQLLYEKTFLYWRNLKRFEDIATKISSTES